MRILLVDGDGDLLHRIRRAFWKSHRAWEVILAQTGSEALQVLGRDQVDIVISALKLPDMEGAELIHRVRELQPGAVRIALADPVLAEWTEQVEGDLHRLFIKPLEPDFLIGAVESLDIEDDATSVRAVRAFVGGLGRIPSLPSLYSELVALLQREDAGMGEVARLIRRDLGVASQVLKLANSVHCASDRPVAELGQALAMLGVDSLRSLVLFGASFPASIPRAPRASIWSSCGSIPSRWPPASANWSVLEGETQSADLAFSVGLLHDIGLVVLATDPSHRYKSILERAQSSRIPLAVLEHDTYGVDHAQIGAHLLNLWGLPPVFCRPVREHHAPPAGGEGFPFSAALHLADARHGGGSTAGIFADGRWGLHPHVLGDAERFARWKACLSRRGHLRTGQRFLEDLARVEDVPRIQGLLDGPQGVELGRIAQGQEGIPLGEADAVFAAEGTAEAQGQPEEVHELPLQQGGIGLACGQQVHMQVPIAQVAVGDEGEAEPIEPCEELAQATAGHHDVLADLLRVTFLQEGTGHAADGPDVLALAFVRGDLQALGHGAQQVEESSRKASEPQPRSSNSRMARASPGRRRASSGPWARSSASTAGSKNSKALGRKPAPKRRPGRSSRSSQRFTGSSRVVNSRGRGVEAQGGAQDEAEDAFAADEQLTQGGAGIGLHAADAEGVDLAIFQEGLHGQHPVARHAGTCRRWVRRHWWPGSRPGHSSPRSSDRAGRRVPGLPPRLSPPAGAHWPGR